MSIVNKSLQHYKNLVNNNYVFSGNYQINEMFGDITEVYTSQKESQTGYEIVNNFVNCCCEFCSTEEGTHTYLLYNAFKNFCDANNVYVSIDVNKFSTLLNQVCGEFVEHKRWRNTEESKNVWGYKGIKLKSL